MLLRTSLIAASAIAIVFSQTLSAQTASAQAAVSAQAETAVPDLPKVTQVDIVGLKKLIKPTKRPLLINFWATWCPPCTDEFPDLVKIENDYRGKIDVITVSLDDLADINTYVPKFLADMKAEMPAYLLHTKDEGAAIRLIAKDWTGNLPMTVLYDTSGNVSYMRNGRIRVQPLRDNIDKLLTPPASVK